MARRVNDIVHFEIKLEMIRRRRNSEVIVLRDKISKKLLVCQNTEFRKRVLRG